MRDTGRGWWGTGGTVARGADDENTRHVSVGRHVGWPGQPHGSRRAHTVARQRLRGAAAPAGHSWGPATARRRPVACFTATHRVPFGGFWHIPPEKYTFHRLSWSRPESFTIFWILQRVTRIMSHQLTRPDDREVTRWAKQLHRRATTAPSPLISRIEPPAEANKGTKSFIGLLYYQSYQ
jgi:hypothetical protein